MYKLHLILKYLLRRRIAWVSLVAVMLCTTMVVVVRSVMGGWLDMFREQFHGITGDIVIEGATLSGFPYYQEMVSGVEKLPEVEVAAPTIYSYGLINIANRKSDGVQVIGYPLDKISRINRFPTSLYRQYKSLIEEAEAEGTPPMRAQLLRKMAELPPTFDLRTYTRVPMAQLPGDLNLPESGKLIYDPHNKWLRFDGIMTKAERDTLSSLSKDELFRTAIAIIYERSQNEVVDYATVLPRSRTDVTKWPGLVASIGVLDIRRNSKGGQENRFPQLYEFPAKLTLIGMQQGSISVDLAEKAERNFWIVDDSHTGVSIFDAKTVYVPFDVVQNMLGMGEKVATDKTTNEKIVEPARANDIQIKLKPGIDLQAAKLKIAKVVEEVKAAHPEAEGLTPDNPLVETWEEDKAKFISAIENETVLVTGLFGIISIVAVFLIFCIFYMIVVEKTKDIGIIKSVGATAGGVAGIFLGYGLAIGLVGAALGLLLSYLIVTNINYLHSKLAEVMGRQIWNPEVYLFDKIPNKLEPAAVAVILGAMVVASVIGALIPAIVAAAKRPVDSLRWE
jgi:lipoprotein-releasing system permease protein